MHGTFSIVYMFLHMCGLYQTQTVESFQVWTCWVESPLCYFSVTVSICYQMSHYWINVTKTCRNGLFGCTFTTFAVSLIQDGCHKRSDWPYHIKGCNVFNFIDKEVEFCVLSQKIISHTSFECKQIVQNLYLNFVMQGCKWNPFLQGMLFSCMKKYFFQASLKTRNEFKLYRF